MRGGGELSSSDALAIFQQFWPTKGYAGIKQHLPDWSQSRASNFAWRNGIRMKPESKRENYQRTGEAASAAMREKAQASWDGKPQSTTVNRALAMRW